MPLNEEETVPLQVRENRNKRKRIKKIKYIVFTLLSILLMLVGIVFLSLNLPSVQERIRQQVVAELKRKLNTDLDIAGIQIEPLSSIHIKGLYINDLQGDTALKVKDAYLGVDLLPLLWRQVVITSASLSDFEVNLSKKDKQAPLNINFIVEALASKDTTKSAPYEVKIDLVNLKRGQLKYDIKNQPTVVDKMDFNHLKFSDINAKLRIKSIVSDSLNVVIRQLALKERSGLQVDNVAGRFTSNGKTWDVRGLQLKMPGSELNFGTISLALNNHQSIEDKLFASLQILPSYVTLGDVSALVPALKNFKDRLQLQAQIDGKIDNINVKKVHLTYGDGKMELIAHGRVKEVQRKDSLFVEGVVEKLAFNKEGIDGLLPNLASNKLSVPDFVKNFRQVSFSGKVAGKLNRLQANGMFSSDLGDINTEAVFGFLPNKEVYLDGKVSTTEFAIGTLFANKDLDKVSLEVMLNLRKKSGQKMPEVVAKGSVPRFDYKGYSYKNIHLDGEFIDKKINGLFSIDDPNARMSATGMVNLSSPKPILNVQADVAHVQLDALNLYNKQQPSSLSMQVDADFEGNNLDNAVGKLLLRDIRFTKANANLKLAEVAVNAWRDSMQYLTVRSDVLEGEVRGKYSFANLFIAIRNTVSEYLPTLVSPSKSVDIMPNDINFVFLVRNTEKLSEILNLPVVNYSDAKFIGGYDQRYNRLHVEGFFPSMKLFGQNLTSGHLSVNNLQNERMQLLLDATVATKKGTAQVELNTWAAEDKIHSELNFDNGKEKKFKGSLSAVTQFVRGEDKRMQTQIEILPRNIILNDTLWNVGSANVKIANNVVNVSNFSLQNAEKTQSLKVDGAYSPTDEQQKLEAELDGINLAYVFQMLQIKALNFGGQATGKVVASSIKGKPYYACNLDVANFTFHNALLGKLHLYSELEKETNQVLLAGNITTPAGDSTRVDGFINPITRELRVDFDAQNINIGFLKGYTSTIFNKVEGTGSGKVSLLGNLSKVTVEGEAFIQKGTIGVDMLNTTYTFSDTIHLQQDLIHFKNVRFSDEAGNSALCSGKISHRYFEDITYRIDLNSKNFLVFNGTEKQNPAFSGRMFASGTGSIVGDEQQVHLDMKARTEANSHLRLNFMSEKASEYSFIKYKEREQKDSLQTAQPKVATASKTGMNVFMNFSISATPDATVEIIMDPVSGDAIRGNGTGNIQFEWDLKSMPKIYGNYEISKGSYNFTFQKIMEKRFLIDDGSIVQFRGDPYQATLDIDAVYKITANLKDLSQALSQSSGQTNVLVNCMLNISGVMRHPDIQLGLNLPETDPEVQRQVKNLIVSEDMMNRQIVYLLLLSRFYTPEENSTEGTDSNGNFTSVALATLSSNLTNILNQIDPRWQMGTNIRTSNTGVTDTEVELLLSSRLLNDRLLINGNVGYRDNEYVQNAFVGEVDVEMLLNKSGNLRLKAFSHINDKYFYITSGSLVQTQGLGILYKKDFNRLSELFPRRRRKNNENRTADSIQIIVPDSARKGSSISNFVRIKE